MIINIQFTDLCKAYLLEAKWYYSGYKPTLQEYMDNAWISVSAPVLLCHAYMATDSITKEGLQSFEEYYPNIICSSSIIVRLADDLGTSPVSNINTNHHILNYEDSI